MSKSNYITSTGHRFISTGTTAFKIHIHTPDDTIAHRSVGFVRIGKNKALKKAIKVRNALGYELWGKHWKRVLREPHLFTRLPHSLEPTVIQKPRPTKADPHRVQSYYLARWWTYDSKGGKTYNSVLANISRMGKLAAYNKAKRALLDAHEENVQILSYMGRISIIKHQ
ncbi:Fe3+-citrate ABC transporter substrate-binding protein [Vibrio tubiashii]|uniref:Fe3+-citrate ABC transporter substrate-binding protein n=1 Tax=Vibrio tubiashii TaxID=29498 RepID=UPI0030B86BCA